MITLSVGKSYPLPTQGIGAAAQFLRDTGNILQIMLPDISAGELFALKKGRVKAGFLYENGDMLWLFTFYDQAGPVLTLDAPFDIRLYSRDVMALHDIQSPEERLTIEIHIINEKHILRALRLITMPHELTLAFLSAVQDQLASSASGISMARWLQNEPSRLTQFANMYGLGS
jgi:hypothetical protein